MEAQLLIQSLVHVKDYISSEYSTQTAPTLSFSLAARAKSLGIGIVVLLGFMPLLLTLAFLSALPLSGHGLLQGGTGA